MENTAGQAAATRYTPGEDDGSPEAAAFVACQRLADATLPAHRLRALLDAAGGDPARALALSEAQLVAPPIGLTVKQAARLKEAASAPLLPRFFERARTLGVYVLTWRDPAYPANLAPLADAPPLHFVRGELRPDDRFSVAVVGSRRATNYGKGQADAFARAFADSGLALISGGAAGIDTAAHRGALEAGGRTVAVLGCGVDIVYPAENRDLFARIAANGGALVSEFALGTKPEPWRFPTRNRIIAGIARATVLIETPENSGALGTARCAADYGRDLWVVPGPVDTGRSRGGHRLVQDGALLADAPEDILAALGIVVEGVSDGRQAAQAAVNLQPKLPEAAPVAPAAPAPPPPDLSPDEAKLLAGFGLTARHLDEAAEGAGLPAPQATVAATLLEMKGLIRRQPGGLFVRVL
jgi:DNA processing protein